MTDPNTVQLTEDGRLKHFLTTEGLSRELLTEILDTADSFISTQERAVKTVPLLRGKTVVNLFFENSTRTRSTFELAAKRLSADILNLDIARSATSKGETLMDTSGTSRLCTATCSSFVIQTQALRILLPNR